LKVHFSHYDDDSISKEKNINMILEQLRKNNIKNVSTNDINRVINNFKKQI